MAKTQLDNDSLALTRLTVNGTVGINTTTPDTSYKLDVFGYGRFGNTGTGFDVIDLNSTNGVQLRAQAQGNTSIASIGTTSNNAFYFFTNNTERVRIDTSGNLGIGISNPGAKLSLGGGIGKKMLAYDAGTANPQSGIGIDMSGNSNELSLFAGTGDGNSGRISFGRLNTTSGAYTQTMCIDGAGKIGINNAAPSARLHIGPVANNGATLSDTVAFSGYSTTAQYRYIINHNGTGMLGIGSDGAGAMIFGRSVDFAGTPQAEYARIDISGNLLVGVTSGAYKITANGAIYTSLGSGGMALSGDGTPDNGYLGYNYVNVSGTETAPTASRSSWRVGFSNGATDAMTFSRRAANAAAGTWAEFGRFDSSGNLLVGATSGSNHIINKSGTVEGGIVLAFQGAGNSIAYLQDVRGGGANAASSGFYIGKHSTTSRSINAAGTVNASGADYAEYYHKAEACGVIPKGAIVGIDLDGKLTDLWAAAVSFLIKSTNPSYVGGDAWGREDVLGMARPVEPEFIVPEYAGTTAPACTAVPPATPALSEPHPPQVPQAPAVPAEDADAGVLTAYQQALADHQAALVEYATLLDDYHRQLADYVAARAAYDADCAAYASALASYNAELEAYQRDAADHAAQVAAARAAFAATTYAAYLQQLDVFVALLEQARQKVDRIAYCGQVPVNVLGATPGQYVVPVQDGDGIGALLVDDAAITFAQYRRAVGVVQNILPDGRANVRVKPV